jgi:lantibiotic transport system ATP-binding protein
MQSLAVRSIGLGKRFGSLWAMRDVDLAVPTRAIYGFLGSNGAGKTTTIRTLLGLLHPSEGAIHVFGADSVRNRRAVARKIGALLDARATYDQLSGRENLEITTRLLKLPPTEIDRVLDYVSLSKDAAGKVAHYSLGMRQRLGLARALLGSPELLILDEPMNGLDPDGIRDMRAIIRDLPVRAGATVFLSSHLLSEVEHVATHIGLMQSGRLILQGEIDNVLAGVPAELRIRATPMALAGSRLRESGYVAEARENAFVVPLTRGDVEAAQINRQLFDSGVNVIESTHRRASLEALYTQLAAAHKQTDRKAA